MSEENIIDTGTKRFVKIVEYVNSPDYKPLIIASIIGVGLYFINRKK